MNESMIHNNLSYNDRKKSIFSILKENIPIYLMILPSVALLLVFSVYPICWAIRYCLYDWDGIGIAKFVGLDNFIRAFTRDPFWWRAVLNTILFAIIKLAIEIPFALILAFTLNSDIKGKSAYRNIYFLPSAVSIAVLSLAFTALLSPYNGFINNFLLKLGIINQSINWLGHPVYAFLICILLSVWQFFGQNTLLFIAGLQGIPNEIYESAEIDGATKMQMFRKITVPMLMPVLQMVLMMAIIGSLNSFDIVFVLTGGGPENATELMALNIYNRFFADGGAREYGYGSALGVLCSIIIGLVSIFYLSTSQRIKEKYQ